MACKAQLLETCIPNKDRKPPHQPTIIDGVRHHRVHTNLQRLVVGQGHRRRPIVAIERSQPA
jgi:hypothetical protein